MESLEKELGVLLAEQMREQMNNLSAAVQLLTDELGDKIQWIHYSDSHHEILGTGEYGREKLEGYIRTLEKYDYKNCVDLEINDSIYWEDPHTSIQQSADYLRAFLPEK